MMLMDVGTASELALRVWVRVLHARDWPVVDGKARYLALPEIESDGL